MEGIEG